MKRARFQVSIISAAVGLLALGCQNSGPAEPGKFEDFVTKIGVGGITQPPNCNKANDGKKFSLEGYLHIANSMNLENGGTHLEVFQRNKPEGEGDGESFQVRVSLGNWLSKGDIDDLWDSAKNVKSSFRGQQGEISEDALHVHLADGSVGGHKDKLRLSVRIEVLPVIDPKMPPACEYVFISAAKE